MDPRFYLGRPHDASAQFIQHNDYDRLPVNPPRSPYAAPPPPPPPPPVRIVREDIGPAPPPIPPIKDGKRLIVIDGSNVAMSHGNDAFFSWPGIDICVRLFLERGHRDVVAFVPSSKREFQTDSPNPARDRSIIERLTRANHLKFTPARKIPRADGSHSREVAYDDPVILSMANDHDGVVVSNDFFRDLINVDPRFRRVIEERAIGFTFYKNTLCIPTDLHGKKAGMTVEQLLDRNAPSRPAGSPAYPISITVNEYEDAGPPYPDSYWMDHRDHGRSLEFRGTNGPQGRLFPFQPDTRSLSYPVTSELPPSRLRPHCLQEDSGEAMSRRPVSEQQPVSSPRVTCLGPPTGAPPPPVTPKRRKRHRKTRTERRAEMDPLDLYNSTFKSHISNSSTSMKTPASTLTETLAKSKVQKMRDKLYSFLEEETAVLPPVTMCAAGRPGEALRYLCLLCVRSFKRESHLLGHLNTAPHYANVLRRDKIIQEFRGERYEKLRHPGSGHQQKHSASNELKARTFEELLKDASSLVESN
ncbi:putative ribonuclease ZC3H12B [Hypsibius exemplaris]|uniref:Ribonuclease ZC3H12B n=1 Tax=Hypsibius exemplaris TaxID=2072580 RepID=A0A1W0WQ73_HYPEX|nr:putative ribonuclease ZC3H12B [Hypsibius exemplaris]